MVGFLGLESFETPDLLGNNIPLEV